MPESMPNVQALLAAQVGRKLGQAENLTTAFSALSLHQRLRPRQEHPCLYQPNVTLVLSGQKRVTLAEESYLMSQQHFLLTSANLPVTPQIVEASREQPFLAVMLTLDMTALATLLLNRNLPPASKSSSQRAIALGETTPELLNAFQRLILLLDSPRDLPILGPLIQQEILYRLLVTPQGYHLRDMAAGGRIQRVARATHWLEQHFSQTLNVAELAEHVGLSVSAFHRLFKEVTAMSPLQYQKTLRLSEAQRLMINQQMEAARAAFEVGYVSSSQFSREYRRQFGASPSSHIAGLRQMA
ncbi:HTH-type transcriptional activator RhaS [Deinococcus xinjiangensis]|uniref:HTH-type transcriptional activator RhaS n=1 Tax=Deinococcus xinjiangensis TaxID=457454 RepID=A0ABP9VL46_9DEIO